MFEPNDKGVYAVIAASPIRRTFAYVVLLLLGGMLIYLALFEPVSAVWSVVLIGAGALALYLGERLRRATSVMIELTADEVRDTAGRVLARVADIRSVDSGVFAIKPSNGFTLVLSTRGDRAWEPGLWWRVGRRVGVGGVIPSAQAKFMAEIIASWLAART